MPQIIAFSNREFYSGALKVMTQRPETAQLDCVHVRRVPGGKKVQGLNEAEGRALVDEVVRKIAEEEPLSKNVCHSLGILSPLRDQVDFLSGLLQERVSMEAVQKHDLMVGTAHTFQGEERDVMYLSLVLDPTAHPASFRFLNNPNVFNVSITRARTEQHVFCSVGPEELPGDTLLWRYLSAAAAGPRPRPATPTAPPDQFLEEVREELLRDGFRTWAAYPVAGMNIDLVAERAGKTLGIDLVGYPGEFAALLEVERYRMFGRAGLVLFPLPLRAWREDRAGCLDAIRRWHDRLRA